MMLRDWQRLGHAFIAVVGVAAFTPPSATAQGARGALVRGGEAWNNGEFETAVSQLSIGLNPASAPRDSLWIGGVHMLADALIALADETGNDRLAQEADVWVIWAVRQMPDIPVDRENFPDEVVEVFEAARGIVAQTAPVDLTVIPSWRWPANPQTGRLGAIRIRREQVVVNAGIDGVGFFTSGTDYRLTPGSYTITASADGFVPGRVTVEVLPGVTTVLDLKLQPLRAGFLYVASRPWGEVFLDGDRIGYTTVAARRMTVGSHRMRIERVGYFPFDTTFTVQADERLRFGTIELRPRGR